MKPSLEPSLPYKLYNLSDLAYARPDFGRYCARFGAADLRPGRAGEGSAQRQRQRRVARYARSKILVIGGSSTTLPCGACGVTPFYF